MTTVQYGRPRTHEKLRVLFLIRLAEGGREGFLSAYESIRHSVADVPGHILDQLGAPVDDSRQWVITSEWETPEHFFAWQQSEEHRALVAPMGAWIEKAESLRFRVVEETPDPAAGGRR
ncbi:antibiotic biosynthesis monooxygenase family protein [Peterkaempfera bronchialis]|uniref:Antibiotic biosynthesis monooxygenase n=1 Tax=Peterkaempfera bronchialis TaxID=2126346 RepID=A0A345T4E1_9ACTN|nr:antibiotic biosynthesis monooxygenase family protein [Peterkaempfera bronchialis]AXI80846.1 antibiotic biosynthesis monooxygenase [Peterkaempfera bronchialis]